MNIFYERLNALCKEAGTTYNAVCLTLGIRSSVIGNLRSRENSVPKVDTVLAFAKYFDVSPDYLIGETDEKNAATSGDGIVPISEKDKRLLDWFRSLPEEKQNAILISQDAPKDLL